MVVVVVVVVLVVLDACSTVCMSTAVKIDAPTVTETNLQVTPGAPVTPEPSTTKNCWPSRAPQKLRTKLALNVQMDGVRKCSKMRRKTLRHTPRTCRWNDLRAHPLSRRLLELSLHDHSDANQGTCGCTTTGASTTIPRTAPVESLDILLRSLHCGDPSLRHSWSVRHLTMNWI